ncbi:uncharacterized protein V6R79_002071 [Siganus canaliculatus]
MNASLNACTAEMPYGYYPQFNRLYIASELIVATLAIVGNFLVCLAVACNRKLRTATNYFLVSLAVADILVGLVAIPCAVLTDLGLPHHNLPLCLLLVCMMIVLTQSSILSMLAIAAERYLAILLPFQYQRIMTPRNAKLVLLVTWCLAAVSGSVPLMDFQKQPANSDYCIFTCVVDMSYIVYFNFFCWFLAPLVVMFIIYGRIFLTVRRQVKRITVVRRKAEVPAATASTLRGDTVSTDAGGTTPGGPDSGTRSKSSIGSLIETDTTAVFTKPGFRITLADSSRESSKLRKHKSLMSRELRKATSLFLVLFLFMICWMPINLINCILLFGPQVELPMSATLVAILLSHVNSALNPVLYSYSMRSFRRALMGMWKELWKPKLQ